MLHVWSTNPAHDVAQTVKQGGWHRANLIYEQHTESVQTRTHSMPLEDDTQPCSPGQRTSVHAKQRMKSLASKHESS